MNVVGDVIANPDSAERLNIDRVRFVSKTDNSMVETERRGQYSLWNCSGWLNLSAMQRIVDLFDALPQGTKDHYESFRRRAFDL